MNTVNRGKPYLTKNGHSVVPPGNRILIQKDAATTRSAGGIILPDTESSVVCLGTVVAVGPGERSPDTGQPVGMDMEVGDRVVFAQYSGTAVEFGEEKFHILSESEVQLRVTAVEADPG